jgi:hypothetical protein
MSKIIIIQLFAALLFVACSTEKKPVTLQVTKEDLFAQKTVLELTLQMSLDSVRKDVGEQRSWHNAWLIWQGKKIKLRVKTRGNFRRNPENCNFPPLQVNFDTTTTVHTPFAAYDKLRLVTHCQQNDSLYEQMLVEEYGIYQTYNLITPKSIRTRLLKINYQDLADSNYQFTKLAFFIESSHQMAKRLQATWLQSKDTVTYLQCNSFVATQMAVFQFMIGNTDWSVSNQHNIDILQTATQEYLPVPYDFDFAGLIDAPYAGTDSRLPISGVTQRVYRGYCQSEAEVHLVLDKFKKQQSNIDSLWQSLPYHQAARRQKSKEYLQSFYQLIAQPDSVDWYFIKNCR